MLPKEHPFPDEEHPLPQRDLIDRAADRLATPVAEAGP